MTARWATRIWPSATTSSRKTVCAFCAATSDARGGNQSNLNAQLIRELKIALPDLATQRAIVAEIEAEQALVAANRELITRMEAKIRAVMDRVWGKSLENSG